jgi:hypothetical protein
VNALAGWQSLISKPGTAAPPFEFPDTLTASFGRFLQREHAFAVVIANSVEDLAFADSQLAWEATQPLPAVDDVAASECPVKVTIVSGALEGGHLRLAHKLASLRE